MLVYTVPSLLPQIHATFSVCVRLSHVDIWVKIEVNCTRVRYQENISSFNVCNTDVVQHTLGTLKHIGLPRTWSVTPHITVVESGIRYRLPIHFTDWKLFPKSSHSLPDSGYSAPEVAATCTYHSLLVLPFIALVVTSISSVSTQP